jgi:hypothetical protein
VLTTTKLKANITSLIDSCPTPESNPKSTNKLTQTNTINVLILLSALNIVADTALIRENKNNQTKTTGINIYGSGLFSGDINRNVATIAEKLTNATAVYLLTNFLFMSLPILQ